MSIAKDAEGPRTGRLAAYLDLALVAGMVALLWVLSQPSPTDALPRPIVIGALFAVPGLVGWIGASAGDRWLFLGAALALIPASFISWAGVTLVFLIPGFLFLLAVARTPSQSSGAANLVALARGLLVGALMLSALVTVLFVSTASACTTVNGEITACSSAAVTWQGIALGAAILVGALALAMSSLVFRATSDL